MQHLFYNLFQGVSKKKFPQNSSIRQETPNANKIYCLLSTKRNATKKNDKWKNLHQITAHMFSIGIMHSHRTTPDTLFRDASTWLVRIGPKTQITTAHRQLTTSWKCHERAIAQFGWVCFICGTANAAAKRTTKRRVACLSFSWRCAAISRAFLCRGLCLV